MNFDDLFRMVWNQIWQLTALVAVVALLVRLAARRRPHLAYVLWLVVLAKCLTPPVMASPGGIFCWMQSPQPVPAATFETYDERFALLDAGTSASLLNLMTESGTTVESHERLANHDSTTKARWNNAEPDDAVTAGEQREHGERRLPRHSDDAAGATSIPSRWGLPVFFLWIGILWLAGSVALVVLASLRLAVCLRHFRRSAVDSHPALAALVVDLAGRLKVRRPVRLIVTASRIGPAVVGLWRPTIVLPTAVVQGKSPDELEPILAHELIHVRRGDLWISLWQVLAQAVWWFHPLVWLANRLTTRAAEACCDEEAIAALGCDPERYARSLLAVLEHKRSLISVPAFPGMRPVDVTRERLERIMQLGQGCRNRTPWWCWLVLILAAAITLPGAAFVASADVGQLSKLPDESPTEPAKADGEPAKTTAERDRPQEESPEAAAYQERQPGPAETPDRKIEAALAAEPPAELTSAMSFVLHTNSETKKVDQALLANADEIRTRSEKIIKGGKLAEEGAPDGWASLSGNLRIWLQDGSMKATARTAVIETISQRYSAGRGKTLRIRLHGNVRWTSGELTASAGKLTVVVEPLFPDHASGPRLSEMILEGGVELQGKEFEAKADTIGVHFDPAKDLPKQRSLRILMRGNAMLSHKKVPGGDESHLRAAQIEYSPEVGSVKVDAAGTLTQTQQAGPLPTWDSAASTRIFDDRRRKSKKESSLSPDELVTLTYSVADLVVPVEHMYIATSKDLMFIPSSDERKSQARTGSPDEFVPRTEANFTDLMELISSTVSPESWVDQKGSGSMMPYRTTLSLVIRQTQAVHEQIADLLGQLRRLQDLSVELKLDVISIAGGASKNPLKFDHDPADSKVGFSYLDESELKAFRKLVETSAEAAVLDGPTMVLQNGQGGELKLRRRLLSTGTSPLPALHVVPVIAADRSAVRLQLAVGASKPLDALARSHLYEVRKGHSLLIDVTDELSWNHISGPIGAQAALIRRQHKVAPVERVLLLITPQVVEVEEEEVGWLTDGPDVRR